MPSPTPPVETPKAAPARALAERVCTLNGRQYIIPDCKMKGAELREKLLELAGVEALKGILVVAIKLEDGRRVLTRVTPGCSLGSVMPEPGTLPTASPLSFYTVQDANA